jgi:threonine dehydrogenase-like Zn-dependent dehydrogenase
MRAVAVFPNEKSIRLVDHPEPTLEHDSDVLLEMLDVGVCGTDREIARFDYGTPPPGSDYLVLGHESLGRVLRVGSSVTRLKAGDLVVPMVRRPCTRPDCRACTKGRQDFCFTGEFTERGIKERHGYMTERVVDDQRFMHSVPVHLRDVAILVEPLTIAEKALIQVWDIQERLPWSVAGTEEQDGVGQKAVVLGGGPVGLLGALALLVRGFETWVYSLEPADSDKARWTEAVGAKYICAATTPIAQVSDQVGEIDLFYEATGASKLSVLAIEELGPNGVFCFTGVPGRKGPIDIDGDLMMRNLVLKNQLVFGTVNAGNEAFSDAVDDLAKFHARWPEQLRALITGRFAPEAAIDLLLGPASGIKRVVTFGN